MEAEWPKPRAGDGSRQPGVGGGRYDDDSAL